MNKPAMNQKAVNKQAMTKNLKKSAIMKQGVQYSALIAAMSFAVVGLHSTVVFAVENDVVAVENNMVTAENVTNTATEPMLNTSPVSVENAVTSSAADITAEKERTPSPSLPPIDESTYIANPKDKDVAALQAHLLPFYADKDAVQYYHAKKAATWLSYAAHEGSERAPNKTMRKTALAEAERIISALEHGQADQLSLTTTVPKGSEVMRRDLWSNAEWLKYQTGFSCAQSQVAQAEVMLVWAAAEQCELGWRHSREKFLAAQRLLDKANDQALSCQSQQGQATFRQDMPKINYPSFDALNGGQNICQGVKGAWPIWAPAAASE